jgi:hypothetical protein
MRTRSVLIILGISGDWKIQEGDASRRTCAAVELRPTFCVQAVEDDAVAMMSLMLKAPGDAGDRRNACAGAFCGLALGHFRIQHLSERPALAQRIDLAWRADIIEKT